MSDFDHTSFREVVASSKLQAWRPTIERLSKSTGVPVDDLVHYALTRWTSAGSEALMSIDPKVLSDLVEAREAEDWNKVAGILDWLRAGLDQPSTG